MANQWQTRKLRQLLIACCFLFGQDLLETVFENGSLVKEYTFAQVRENAEIPLVKEAKKNGLISA